MTHREFLAEQHLVLQYSEELTVEAFFIAGVSAARSEFKLEKILKYLKKVQEAFDEGTLSKVNKALIEFQFYQGKVHEGIGMLKNHQNLLRLPRPELNKNKNIALTIPALPQKSQKLNSEDLRKCEMTIIETLNTLRRIDEKEALAQRKIEEQKRVDAEIAAKELINNLEKEYQEKLKQELEEQRRKEEQAIRCLICKDKVQDKELYMMENCVHTMHKKCFKEFVVKEYEEKRVPVRCGGCKVELSITEIKSQISKRQAAAYEDLLFKEFMQGENSEFSCCPTPACSFMFEYEENQNELDCPMCKRSWCLYCRRPSHKGNTCNQFFNGFNKGFVFGMGKGQKLKSCMMCGIWVEKQDGLKLTCTCGTSFCYTCGSYQGCKCG